MLLTLKIENIAIIEQLELNFDKGFVVLTGETGAGKSILIDALNALLGGRITRDLIRTGSDKALVQGLFDVPPSVAELLEDMGIEPLEDGSVLLQRNFTESGRNTCRINGALATVSMLKTIGERLVDIHGQHDNQSLLRPETHIVLLDFFAGSALFAKKAMYSKELKAWNVLNGELKELAGSGRDRERKMDMLRYQIDELEKVSIKMGEDEELEQKSQLLANAEGIVSAFSDSWSALRGDDENGKGAIDQLKFAALALKKVCGLSPDFQVVVDALEESIETLSDLSRDIRDIRDNTEFDPKLQQKIEERINVLQGIKRKYGEKLHDCLKYLDDSRNNLEILMNSEEKILEYRKRIQQQEAILDGICSDMHDARVNAAVILSTEIQKQLMDLEMPKTSFSVSIIQDKTHGYGENGTDLVEFLISTNSGEPMKPLSRIASGGEMSRVMLAIKTILADTDRIPTLIFDEIDSGVGGKAAQKVGLKLAGLSDKHQVLCVTHHAQIAGLADVHFYIEKRELNGRTHTQIHRLETIEREEEMTRLLSGEHRTESARNLARELLNSRAGSPSLQIEKKQKPQKNKN
jgi:DNA repair protein RecN (Recombination protein N)